MKIDPTPERRFARGQEAESELAANGPLSWTECLKHLGRSESEIMHRIANGRVYKAVSFGERALVLELAAGAEAGGDPHIRWTTALRVGFPHGGDTPELRAAAADYVREWFGLDDNLQAFYDMARRDPVLAPAAAAHQGLRLIGIPDLFEALVWSIIGQQIGLGFAYTLKKRLVEAYGEVLPVNTAAGEPPYRLFPRPARLAALNPDALRPLQFSVRKAEYIIGIARLIEGGRLCRSALLKLDEEEARAQLLAIRGVGAWTADYVGMKCLRRPSAFPAADAGLHQALRRELKLGRKPLPAEIAQAAAPWRGHEAYATFYLWQSLLE